MKYHDGSSRTSRPNQVDYFKYFDSIKNKYKYHVLVASPGSGKSYIAKSICKSLQHATIVTPSNQLVRQYCDTYSDLVPIMGMDNYDSEEDYRKARRMAATSPAIFNPVSFYYYYLSRPHERPEFVVIDEAHSLAGLLTSVVSQNFPCAYWGIPDKLDDKGFLEWISARAEKLAKVKDNTKFVKQYEKLFLLKQYVTQNLRNIKIDYQMLPNFKTGIKELNLCVSPLTFPKDLLDLVFGEGTKILFMSGTFNKLHMKELGIKEYSFKEYNHPAPRENRIIEHIPVKDRKSDYELAMLIRKIYEKRLDNTLIHIPYNYQNNTSFKKLLGIFNPITHTKDTKDAALAKFKRNGGILLASGMAEGIDLPGDQCRLLIIPKILWPNLGADSVKKRMLFPDGQRWYHNQALTSTIQQIYRGLRGKDDWCKVMILDPTFKRLIDYMRPYISDDFYNSIKWS